MSTSKAADGYAGLAEKAPAFLPGWSPPGASATGGPIEALLRVAGRYRDVLADVVGRAGLKARLAHLDALGASLRPAQPASGVVVFALDPSGSDGDAPAGTQLGASSPGASSPVVFETVDPVVLVAAPLVDVVLVDPDAEQVTYVAGITPPGGGQEPVPHALYLGDPTALIVIPGASIDVNLTLAAGPPGTVPQAVALTWEFFDGTGWHAFLPPQDGTNGLTRSGTIKLAAGEASAATTTIDGVGPMYWVRARAAPLPGGTAAAPTPSAVWPTIARSTVDSRLEPPLLVMDPGLTNVPLAGSSVTLQLLDEDNLPLVMPNVFLTIDPLGDARPPTGTPDPVLGKVAATPGGPPVPIPVPDRADYTLTLVTTTTNPDGTTNVLTQDTQVVRLYDRTALGVVARRQAELLDKAFNDVLKVDPTSTFAPSARAPRPGSSFVFYQRRRLQPPRRDRHALFRGARRPDQARRPRRGAATRGDPHPRRRRDLRAGVARGARTGRIRTDEQRTREGGRRGLARDSWRRRLDRARSARALGTPPRSPDPAAARAARNRPRARTGSDTGSGSGSSSGSGRRRPLVHDRSAPSRHPDAARPRCGARGVDRLRLGDPHAER